MNSAEGVKPIVLVLGSGAREHALAWKLGQQADVYVGPGNAGIDQDRRICVDPLDPEEVLEVALDTHASLVVVGSETALKKGVVDMLRTHNVVVYGPDRHGAQLETSKIFSTGFMDEFGIPHPKSRVFDNYWHAWQYVSHVSHQTVQNGLVFKADGLCGGKGVVITHDRDEAQHTIERFMVEEEFDDAGMRLVVQEKVTGFEVSVMAIVAGGEYILLPCSKDYKQIYDGGRGPNTGGMGAIAPHPQVTAEMLREIEQMVVAPTVAGLVKKGIDFRGTLYPGIMMTADGPKVLEYNVRFGDPETQALVPLLDGDLYYTLREAAKGLLPFTGEYPINNLHTVTVVLASKGYPGAFEQDKTIWGLSAPMFYDAHIFHAGTKSEGDSTVTSGGRVFAVTGVDADPAQARENAYETAANIRFDGQHYRTDIGETYGG